MSEKRCRASLRMAMGGIRVGCNPGEVAKYLASFRARCSDRSATRKEGP